MGMKIWQFAILVLLFGYVIWLSFGLYDGVSRQIKSGMEHKQY
jgi:hypothetical protein